MHATAPSTRPETPTGRPMLVRMRRMVEDIASELELEPLLTRIVEHACTLIGADDGTIGLYEPWHDAIRTVAVCNMPAAELGAVMHRGEGLAGMVLDRGRAQMLRYGDIPSATLAELSDHFVIGMPVRWRGELVGFFGIGAQPPRRFTRRDLAALALFARYAAIAIVNARRYTAERRRQQRFELIVRVAGIIAQGLRPDAFLQRAADAIHEILEYANVDIPLVDDPLRPTELVVRIRGGRYKALIRHEDRLPLHEGIMGSAVREARTQRVNDVAADPRYLCPPGVTPPLAELAVPIHLGNEVFGVINVEGDRPFDDLDVESLEVVAEHLALALDNARLADASRENAVLLERQRLAHELHDSVTQILSSMNLLAQSLPGSWRRDPEEGLRRTRRLGQLAQTAFGEMRNLLAQLAPPRVEASSSPAADEAVGIERLEAGALPAALTELLAIVVPPELKLRLGFTAYRPQCLEHERALFRVCQEAVSNAVRHACAGRLSVNAAVRGQRVVMRIADDGVGISESHGSGGIGLSSMRYRIEGLGGRFAIRSRKPRGTLVEAVLPRADRDGALS